MEDSWKNQTPKGAAIYTLSGSVESGFVCSAQLESSNIRHEGTYPGSVQPTRVQVEKYFATDLK